MRSTTLFLNFAATASLLAADPAMQQKASALKMQATLEKQLESVRRQTGAPTGAFFSTPWLLATTPATTAATVQADCDALAEDQLRPLISNAAQKEGVNPLLVRAVVRRESGGRPCATSDKGAQGLMQLMPITQDHLGVANPFDPAENIAAGTRYLKEMLGRYKGDVRLALAAYNAGPQRVDSAGNVPDIPETRAYVSAIMADLGNEETQP